MMFTPNLLKAARDRMFEIFISHLPAGAAVAIVASLVAITMIVVGNMP